jgi:hypothetical protein
MAICRQLAPATDFTNFAPGMDSQKVLSVMAIFQQLARSGSTPRLDSFPRCPSMCRWKPCGKLSTNRRR